jgi:hypothetical protein
MIDPRFATEHNITEEEEILSQITMLFGDVPMELGREAVNSTMTIPVCLIFEFMFSLILPCQGSYTTSQ